MELEEVRRLVPSGNPIFSLDQYKQYSGDTCDRKWRRGLLSGSGTIRVLSWKVVEEF